MLLTNSTVHIHINTPDKKNNLKFKINSYRSYLHSIRLFSRIVLRVIYYTNTIYYNRKWLLLFDSIFELPCLTRFCK